MTNYSFIKIIAHRTSLTLLGIGLFFSSAFPQTLAITPSGDTVILSNDGTYRKKEAPKEDPQLRNSVQNLGKKYSASNREIKDAYSMALQGWRYTLPQPKSAQAAWGNGDGRTTWWYGYWKNQKTGKPSSRQPELSKSGIWIGDDQDQEGYYRRGGSPAYPTNLERILSSL